jgi:hypothetical protein
MYSPLIPVFQNNTPNIVSDVKVSIRQQVYPLTVAATGSFHSGKFLLSMGYRPLVSDVASWRLSHVHCLAE